MGAGGVDNASKRCIPHIMDLYRPMRIAVMALNVPARTPAPTESADQAPSHRLRSPTCTTHIALDVSGTSRPDGSSDNGDQPRVQGPVIATGGGDSQLVEILRQAQVHILRTHDPIMVLS